MIQRLRMMKLENHTMKKRKVFAKFLYFTCIFINYYSMIDNCYLIKYRAKRKQLVPFHDTHNKLREIMY